MSSPAAAEQDFGPVGGRRASLYTICDAEGFSVSLTDLGARVVRVLVPDRAGQLADVVLGPPSGYDHNFVIDGQAGGLRPVAFLREPRSGRSLMIQCRSTGSSMLFGKFFGRNREW